MGTRIGGELPSSYGLVITVEAPAGTTAAAPVEVGEVYKLSAATAYKLVAAVAADDLGWAGHTHQENTFATYVQNATTAGPNGGNAPLVRTEERSESVKPISVRVLGAWSTILRMAYSGAAPTVGQSVEADGSKKVRALAFNGFTFVLFIDTAKTEVEFLI